MRILPHEQRSPEWYAARLGIPTASGFNNLITATGKRSASFDKYVNQLVAEKITGQPTWSKTTDAMQHGIDTEDEARQFYEFTYEQPVFQVGLCLHDTLDVGASPDGLLGDGDGILEIKCPQPATMVEYLRQEFTCKDGFPSHYKAQVMGQLWITEAQFCDFFAYHPKMRPMCIRVWRDEDYIGELAALVTEAVETIEYQSQKIWRQ